MSKVQRIELDGTDSYKAQSTREVYITKTVAAYRKKASDDNIKEVTGDQWALIAQRIAAEMEASIKSPLAKCRVEL